METIFLLELWGSQVEFSLFPLPDLTPFSSISSRFTSWTFTKNFRMEREQPTPFISLSSRRESVSWSTNHFYCLSFQKAFSDVSDGLGPWYMLLLPPAFSFMTLVIIHLISTFPQNTVSPLKADTIFVTVLCLPHRRCSINICCE